MSDMYQEIILDYYRNPRCKGCMDSPTVKARDVNPSCGDVVEFHLKIESGKIIEAKWDGKGCAISQASASMIAESLQGKDIDYLVKLDKQQVLDMLGIPISMMRLKCALLGLKVAKVAAYSHIGKELDGDVYA